MRTRASIKSHPLHPALVVYPIAFLHSAFACDLVSRLGGKRWLGRAGRRLGLAGLAAAAVAAIPGMIDYLFTIPPGSSAKSRANKHILINSSAVALFGAAQWLRRGDRDRPSLAVVGAEAAGTGLLMTGAWLGSTLIYRNFIGPDHRYPEAGRFSEEEVPFWPGEPVPVAREDELEVDQMKLLRVDGRRIVLGRTEEGYVAFDDHCTHRGGSLADGVMIHGTVQCLWHGSQFDLKSGEVRAGPAREPIQTYPVEVVEGEVRLTIPVEEGEREEDIERERAPATTPEEESRIAPEQAPLAGAAGPMRTRRRRFERGDGRAEGPAPRL